MELDQIPLMEGNNRRKCNFRPNLLLSCLILVVSCTILGIFIGVIVATTPKLEAMEATNTKFNSLMDRINGLLDRVDDIPDVTWNLLTNETKQREIVDMVNDVLDHWNEDREIIHRGIDLINKADQMMNRSQRIPNVTWEFLTNTTEQERLVYVVEEVINHWPGGPTLMETEEFKRRYLRQIK